MLSAGMYRTEWERSYKVMGLGYKNHSTLKIKRYRKRTKDIIYTYICVYIIHFGLNMLIFMCK